MRVVKGLIADRMAGRNLTLELPAERSMTIPFTPFVLPDPAEFGPSDPVGE